MYLSQLSKFWGPPQSPTIHTSKEDRTEFERTKFEFDHMPLRLPRFGKKFLRKPERLLTGE
jgi:hypothetical protein